MTSASIVTVRENDDLELAAQEMAWAHVRHLPVLRNGRIAGIVSERDMLAARADLGKEANRRPVREVMHQPVLLADPDDSIADAAARMTEHRIGCLPVVRDGRLVGILTRDDILAYDAKRPAPPEVTDLLVRDLMKRDPITIVGDDALLNGARLMIGAGVRHLPVVDQTGRIVGVLSDRDVRAAIGDPRRALHDPEVRARVRDLRVWSAMMTPAITVREDTSIAEAVRHLVDRRIGALAVVDDADRPVGLLSYVDILRSLMQPPAANGEART